MAVSAIDSSGHRRQTHAHKHCTRLFESTQDINEFGHKTKVNHLEISAEPAANENNYSIPFETPDDATNTVSDEIETPVDQMNNGVNQISVRRSERLKAK
ncbi:hypothetical protein AVEN_61905-1 [Araneus ventricosus]|uniref:Uncharacterized protein n=1 Tax=Araneus ventricosus TaxID=182803 RepID=A0A4Y2RSV3_ARAVE|nr:hypothetical protein AVEN_61905-1 [Araneus ventricosus]